MLPAESIIDKDVHADGERTKCVDVSLDVVMDVVDCSKGFGYESIGLWIGICESGT